MKISKGIKEKNIEVGNFFDKYQSRNFLVRIIMKNFFSTLLFLIKKSKAHSIYELGGGEGFLVNMLNSLGYDCEGSDFSKKIISIAKNNYPNFKDKFHIEDIFNQNNKTKFDLILVSEVLEHLNEYDKALKEIYKQNAEYFLFTVPYEPLWRILNLLRGKYLLRLGNTPGHINHWSPKSFQKTVAKNFKIVDIKTTVPFIYVLAKKP